MGGTNTNRRSGAFGMGGNAMNAATMAANAGNFKTTQDAWRGGAFSPPQAPSQAYTDAFNKSLSGPGVPTATNWSVGAGKSAGGNWTMGSDGVYSNEQGAQYKYDPASRGWTSLQGYTGPTSSPLSPAQQFKADNPNLFGGLNGNNDRFNAFGYDKGQWQQGLKDAGLSGDAYKTQQGYNPSTIYNADYWAGQLGKPAYNAQGQALTGTGFYSGAVDGVNNNQMKAAMGLEVPREVQRYFAGQAGKNALGWVPNGQGGWIKAPEVMNQQDINDAARKQAMAAFGYEKPGTAGFGSALAAYGSPVLDTSGTTQTGFGGGFTTSAFTGPPQVLAPPTRQQVKQLYKPGGANFITYGGQ